MADIPVTQAYFDTLSRHSNADPNQPLRVSNNRYIFQENISTSACGIALLFPNVEIDGNGFTLTTHTGLYQSSPVLEYPSIANGDFETGDLTGWTVVTGTASVIAVNRKSGSSPYMFGSWTCNIAPGNSAKVRTSGSYATTAGVSYWATANTAQNDQFLTLRILDASDNSVLAEVTKGSELSPPLGKNMPAVGWSSDGRSVKVEFEHTNGGSFSTYVDDVMLTPWVGPSILAGQQWDNFGVVPNHLHPFIFNANTKSSLGSENTVIRNLTIRQANPSYHGDGINACNNQASNLTDPVNTTGIRIEDCDIEYLGPDSSGFFGFNALGGNIHRNIFRGAGESQFVPNRQAMGPAILLNGAYGAYYTVRGNTIRDCSHTGIQIIGCNRFDIDGNFIYAQSRQTDGYGIYASGVQCPDSQWGWIRNNLIDSYTGTNGGDSGRGIMVDGLDHDVLHLVQNVLIEDNTIIVQEYGNWEHDYNSLECTGFRLRCFENATLRNVIFRNNDVTAIAKNETCHAAWGTSVTGAANQVVIEGCEITGNHFKGFWVSPGSSTENKMSGAYCHNVWQDAFNAFPGNEMLIVRDNIFESNGVALVIYSRDSGALSQGPNYATDNVDFGNNEFRLRTADGTIPGSGTPAAITDGVYFGLNASADQMGPPTHKPFGLASSLWTGYSSNNIVFDGACPQPHELGIGYLVDITVLDDVGGNPLEGATVIFTDAELDITVGTTDVNGQVSLNLPEIMRRQNATGNNFDDVTMNPYTVTVNWEPLIFVDQVHTISSSHGGYNPATRRIAFTIIPDGVAPPPPSPTEPAKYFAALAS